MHLHCYAYARLFNSVLFVDLQCNFGALELWSAYSGAHFKQFENTCVVFAD